MASLNLDLNYFDNIKTLRLKGRLGFGSELLPIRLWVHCGKHHPENGVLRGYSDSEIEEICGWQGEAGRMIKVMADLNFILPSENGWQVKDWLAHEGHLAVFRERARNAADARWNEARGRYASSNAQASAKQCSSSTSSTSNTDPALPTSSLEPEIPDPAKDPIKSLVVWFKVLKEIPWDDLRWDHDWMPVYMPMAKELLERCEGRYEMAYGCLDHYGTDWQKKGLSKWGFDGIIKRALEWTASHKKGDDHGQSNFTRFFSALDRQRESRKGAELRGASETVSRLVRDAAPGGQVQTGPPLRRPGNGHEKPVDAVLERKAD